MVSDNFDSEDPSLLDESASSDDPELAPFPMESLEQTNSFDMKYFWIINSIIIVGIIGVLLWCFRKRGAEVIARWSHVSGRNSDMVYALRVARRLEAEKEAKKESPEERKARLLKCFEANGVIMMIDENSYVGDTPADEETGEASTQADSADDFDNENDMDDISTNGQPVAIPMDVKNGNRTVPNCCAICLCPYETGDKLVWSSNERCSHAFHSECIVDWLIKMQDGTPCPCCRQDFTDLPERSDVNKEKQTRTFDLQAISI